MYIYVYGYLSICIYVFMYLYISLYICMYVPGSRSAVSKSNPSVDCSSAGSPGKT